MKIKFLLPALLAFGLVHAAPPAEEGKTIFTSRCAGCHNISKDLTGPALAGIDQRRSMDWIINFVHSPKKVIESGDKDAKAMLDKFKVQMPDHSDLSADNIKSIVEYIKTEATATATAKAKPADEPKQPGYMAIVMKDPALMSVYVSLFAILIAALLFWVKVRNLRKVNARV
jgi:mono/diheme cytochrome c family protein